MLLFGQRVCRRAVDGLPVGAKPMPAYSALVRARTVRLYEDGLSCRAVAELVKVEGRASPHYVTILRWAREAGKGRKLHGHRLPVSGEIVQGLYEKGTPVSEIAQRFHVGIATAYKRLHEAGTKMRPSRIRYGHVLTERRLQDLYLKKNALPKTSRRSSDAMSGRCT